MGCKYTKSIRVEELVAEADHSAKLTQWYDPLDIADLYIRAGDIYESQYKYQDAIIVINKALIYLEDEEEIAKNHIRIAGLYANFDQIEAINYYQRALNITLSDKYNVQCWYKIGLIYEDQINLTAAVEAYQQAKEWLIAARLCRQLHKYKEATKFYLRVNDKIVELTMIIGLCALCTDDRIFIQEILDYFKSLGLMTSNAGKILTKLVIALDNDDIVRFNKAINKILIDHESCSDLVDYIRESYHNKIHRFLL